MHSINRVSRRTFLGWAAALAMVREARAQLPATGKGYPLIIPGYFGTKSGIQLGTQLPASASEDDMQFVRQLGVEWVMTSLPPSECTLESYQGLIQKFAKGGLKV